MFIEFFPEKMEQVIERSFKYDSNLVVSFFNDEKPVSITYMKTDENGNMYFSAKDNRTGTKSTLVCSDFEIWKLKNTNKLECLSPSTRRAYLFSMYNAISLKGKKIEDKFKKNLILYEKAKAKAKYFPYFSELIKKYHSKSPEFPRGDDSGYLVSSMVPKIINDIYGQVTITKYYQRNYSYIVEGEIGVDTKLHAELGNFQIKTNTYPTDFENIDNETTDEFKAKELQKRFIESMSKNVSLKCSYYNALVDNHIENFKKDNMKIFASTNIFQKEIKGLDGPDFS